MNVGAKSAVAFTPSNALAKATAIQQPINIFLLTHS